MTQSDNSSGLLIKENGDGLAHVQLSRPDRLNAIDPALAGELTCYFSGLSTRTDIRVVILSGAGKHFCAGFDLNCVNQMTSSFAETDRLQRLMSRIGLAMYRCPQPVIALLHGAVCGAGFALALAADVRIATSNARMNVAMANVGLTGCDMGISYFLPRAVGRSAAARMMMTGSFVTAQRAEQIGLISSIVTDADLQASGERLAGEMLRLSPMGLRLTKEGLNQALDASCLEDVIALEDRGQIMCIGQHMQEGVAAFKEKRPPDYTRQAQAAGTAAGLRDQG